MQSLPEYNGYVNWHSWIIQLWVDNEEWLYNAYMRIVERVARGEVKASKIRGMVLRFYRDARDYAMQQERTYVRIGKQVQDDLYDHFLSEVEEYRRYNDTTTEGGTN